MGTQRTALVVGAGYAGVMAANRLAGSHTRDLAVTLVNPRTDFIDRIRLHELATSSGRERVAVRRLDEVLHPGVRLIQGAATRIDAADKRVEGVSTDSGAWTLRFDHLVYAVGSGAAGAPIPGAEQYAYSINHVEGARRLRAALQQLDDGGRVLVVGGGATAIETATEVSASRPGLVVTMASAGPAAGFLSVATRRRLFASPAFAKLTILENCPVTAVTAAGGVARDGRFLTADIVIWAGSFTVPDLARNSGLTVDSRGRLIVDRALRSLDDPAIIGAGDAVVLQGSEGAHLRMACATAMPQGAHAAATVLADHQHRDARAFSMGYAALCLSLGRREGLVQLIRRDDTPRRLVLSGRIGGMVKERISRYAMDGLLGERRRAGSYRWLPGPERTNGNDTGRPVPVGDHAVS